MAGGKEPIEVKFRLFDGTDIGPSKYDPNTTVAALKEFVLSRWPQGFTVVRKEPLARNWPCSPVCSLCDQEEETAEHICLRCVFAQEVWLLVASWSKGLVQVPDRDAVVMVWWNNAMTSVSGKMKTKRASIMIYTTWNLWKERNRRVFEGKASSPRRVLQLIKDEVAFRAAACGPDGRIAF